VIGNTVLRQCFILFPWQ